MRFAGYGRILVVALLLIVDVNASRSSLLGKDIGNIPIFHPTEGQALPFMEQSNFGLSEDKFELLLEDLKKGDTRLFQEIFLQHFQDCQKFLQFKYNASYQDAYDATMDALLLFRQRLVDGKVYYGNLRFLFTRMAGQIFLKHYLSDSVQSLEIGEAPELDEEDISIDSDDLDALARAWTMIHSECQELLRMNYYQGMKLSEIASERNKPAATVRKQKERCKEALVSHFKSIVKSRL